MKNLWYVLCFSALILSACDDEYMEPEGTDAAGQSPQTSEYTVNVFIKNVSSAYEDKVDACFNGSTYTVKVTLSGPGNYSVTKSATVNNETEYLEGSFYDTFEGFTERGFYSIDLYINDKLIDQDQCPISQEELDSNGSEEQPLTVLSDNTSPC